MLSQNTKTSTRRNSVSQPDFAFRESSSDSDDSKNDSSKFDNEPDAQVNIPTPKRLVWEHLVTCDEVLRRLGTNPKQGLLSEEAQYRSQTHGRNTLTLPDKEPWWRHVTHCLADPLTILVQICALLCLLAYALNLQDRTYFYMAIFIQALIAFTTMLHLIYWQRSTSALRELKHRGLSNARAVVVRDGNAPKTLHAGELVVGDIVVIREGDTVPADVRILKSHNFAVNSASLTGRSSSVLLSADVASVADPLFATNIAFRGATAVQGACTAVVTATGDDTILATTSSLLLFDEKTKNALAQPPLRENLLDFSINTSICALVVGLILFIVNQYGLRIAIEQNVVSMVGIVVSNVPLGVSVTLTMSLILSARLLEKRYGMIVKNLDTIATMGTTTTVLMDKTGTLTQNETEVSHIAFGGGVHAVNTEWRPPEIMAVHGPRNHDDDDPDIPDNATGNSARSFNALLKAMSLCSSASMSEDGSTIGGDMSDVAMLRFTERFHNTMAYRRLNPLINMIPFDSYHRMMVTVTHEPDTGGIGEGALHVVIKGAPDRILDASDSVNIGMVDDTDGVRTMSVSERNMWDNRVDYFGKRGERTLGYAECYIQDGTNISKAIKDGDVRAIPTMTGMTFLGLVSLSDKPREDAARAIGIFKEAGIRVWIATGDDSITALSAGRTTGLVTRETLTIRDVPGDILRYARHDMTILLEGHHFRQLDDNEMGRLLANDEVVIARATAADKMRIAARLRNADEVVSAVGDGGNDVGMMVLSDAGVSLGHLTNEATCMSTATVSSIHICSDAVCGIPDAVIEGRRIWDNLKKGVIFSLSSNTSQMIPFVVALIFRMPMPLSAGLLVICGALTEAIGCAALSYEEAERAVSTEGWGNDEFEWDSNRHSSGNKRKHRRKRTQMRKLMVSGRAISFACLQIGVMQSLAGIFAYTVSYLHDGLSPRMLVGLDAGRGQFGGTVPDNQRWLAVLVRTRLEDLREGGRGQILGLATQVGWFSKSDREFAKYFSAHPPDGFQQQRVESFDKLQPFQQAFEDMVKIIGHSFNRPPCMGYRCILSKSISKFETNNTEVWNDMRCFSQENRGGVTLLQPEEESLRNIANTKIRTGECVEFWTPRRQYEALQRGQAAMVTGLIIARMVALWTCRKREASGFNRGSNLIMMSVAMLGMVGVILQVNWKLIKSVAMPWWTWTTAIPFSLFIAIYDEVRKALVRRHIRNESEMVVVSNSTLDQVAKWTYFTTAW